MSIILTILKVLGIIILVVLLIVLALVIFVLVSPIRYESVGSAGPDNIRIRLKITWLLKIVKINGSVSNDRILLEVRALWFRILKKAIPWEYPLAKKKEDTPSQDSVPPEKDETESCSAAAEDSEKRPENSSAAAVKAEQAAELHTAAADHESGETVSQRSCSEEPQPLSENVQLSSEEPQPLSENVQLPSEGLQTLSENVQLPSEEPQPLSENVQLPSEEPQPLETDRRKKIKKKKTERTKVKKESGIEKLKKKWADVSEKIQKVRDILEDPSVWKTARLVKRCLFRILDHIRPRILRIHGCFGTGDPALDGQILGIFYMGYPIYGSHGDYRLSSDFQTKTLKGKYYLKGRIMLVVPAFCALRLIADKNIRRLIFKRK